MILNRETEDWLALTYTETCDAGRTKCINDVPAYVIETIQQLHSLEITPELFTSSADVTSQIREISSTGRSPQKLLTAPEAMAVLMRILAAKPIFKGTL